jgi:hypothetical protein
MRFVVFAGLLSLVAAAPALEEKRQTDLDSAPVFTGPPAGFTPGAFPPGGGDFTGSFVRPTGSSGP